jgi:transposase
LLAHAYRAVIKEQIPDASIVFDKFHIVSNYNDVIDEIRREEWRQAEGKEGRQKIH